jgi:hypothetical protein
MTKFNLWPEEPIKKGNDIELAATLEKSSQEKLTIWFRLPSQALPALLGNLDPFVLAVLFSAMEAQADLEIHGEVSPSLLDNLAEFQKAWTLWLPEKYHRIEFSANSERNQLPVTRDGVILAFSGGVDSTFSAWQHRPNPVEPRQKKLVAGVMVHGFDIPVDQPEVFSRAAEKSRNMLASIGVSLIPVSTNLRDLHNDWGDSHGAALAACLILFQRQFNTGLIASSNPYNYLRFPWGSNLITDPMLSNDSFLIINDGSGFDRVEKMRQISQWPEAMQYLRVCWEGMRKDRNCCRCVKCVGAMLGFRAIGQESVTAFPYDISNREIRHLKYKDFRSMRRNIALLSSANFSPATLRSLKLSLFINRARIASNRFPVLKWMFQVFGNRWFLDPDHAGGSSG